MKKTIGIMGGIVLSILALSAQAQTEPTKPVVQPLQQTAPIDTVNRWNPQNNHTVTAITEKYKDKYVVAAPAKTVNDIFPALGKYESSTNPEAASITISQDMENKGMVWIEGLPQGKIKAMLRQSPAIYKIPAQKTEDGKEVLEGTAAFDKETNTLSIVIGKNYNTADPLAAFAPEPQPVEEEKTNAVVVKNKKNKTKLKEKEVAAVKPWMYTGTKVETTVATN